METSIDGSAAISNAGDHVTDILQASQNKPEITAVSKTTENLIMVNDVTKNKDEIDIISNVSDNAELPESVSATSEIIDNTETLNTDNSNSDTSPETKTPKIASDKADDSDKGEARNLTSDTTSPENEVLINSTNEIGVTEKDSPDNLIPDNADKDEITADDDVDEVVVKSENPVVVIKEDPEDIEQLYKTFAYRGERKRKPTDRYVPECVLRNRKSQTANSPEPPEETEEKSKRPEENRCKIKNCNMVFDTKKRLFYHERNAHTEEMSVFKCMQCNIHCESNKELRDHKDCHNDDTFMCQKCELAYDNHCNYLTHSITVHYPTKKTYTCEECQRVLFDKQALKHHIQSHYNLNEQCPICNKYVHKHNLSEHRAAHNEIKCVECGKVCKGQAHYAAHLNVHIGFKPYQCIYCGKGFQNASGRKVHTDIHLGIKRHNCTECNRTFRQLTDLKRHKESHTKTHKGKQLECSYCKKKFLHEISLRQHLRGHTGDHVLKCPQCPKVFTTKTCLKSHIVHGHTRVYNFQCDICENQKFLTKRDLMRHYKSIRHKQRVYAVENKNNES